MVDDTRQVRALLGSILPSAGHLVVWATDGAEALERVAAEAPDLVISDILMPTLDGYGLLRALRARAETAATPFLFYSATDSTEEVARLAGNLSYSGILTKATGPMEILQSVEAALRRGPLPTQGGDPDDYHQEPVALLNAKALDRGADAEAMDSARQDLARELRAVEAQRAELVRRLVSAQEEESRRVAADIHDDSVQVMAAVALRLGVLRMTLNGQDQLQELDELQAAVQTAIRRLRRMLFVLRPAPPDLDGLAGSLEELGAILGREADFAATVAIEVGTAPPPEILVVLYRVAQEALVNVAKHARARHVTIGLREQGQGLGLVIADDGTGFEAEAAPESPGHYGFTSMRDRAEVCGGRLEITSSPGAGTTVACWVPTRIPRAAPA